MDGVKPEPQWHVVKLSIAVHIGYWENVALIDAVSVKKQKDKDHQITTLSDNATAGKVFLSTLPCRSHQYEPNLSWLERRKYSFLMKIEFSMNLDRLMW